jgi:PAS domain S-box-containing protein
MAEKGTAVGTPTQRLSPILLISVFVLLACLTPIAYVTWQTWQSRSAAIAQGFEQAKNLVLSLSQHAARTMAEPNLILLDAIEHLRNDGMGPVGLARLHAILAEHARNSRVIRELGVLDEQGYWRTSSLPERPTHSNGDRDYFIYHRDNPDPGLRINTPVKSRLTGKWTILLTRRVDHPDGRFAGIVLASISTDYFQSFYDTLAVGDLGHVALYRDDGHLLVRRPFDESNLGVNLSATYQQAIAGRSTGFFHVPSVYDGVVRLTAWQRLDDFPLIMTVGRSESDVLAVWRASAITHAGVAFGAAVFILAAALVSITLQRRHERAERAAAEAAHQFELIADAASDIIVRATLDGQRLYISPAVRDMLGYEPAEMMKKDIRDLAHPDDLVVLQQALGALHDGAERSTVIYRGRHRNGHYIWLEVAMRMVRDPETGQPRELVASSRDISSRKVTELQLARAKEAAEIASRAKSNFLSGMSHELRTPLNAIIGFSELMSRQMFGPLGNARYVAYATDIKVSGEHLLQLINDILDHAKIEAGHLELHEEVLEATAMVDFAMQMLALEAQKNRLTVTNDVPPGIRLLGDERRIRQILLNLLSNAIKYTPPDGSIRVAARFSETGDLVLSVTDTGIGIAQSDLALMLQPFTQIDNDRNRGGQGTGLGLTLTKQLAELHGGRLEIESEIGVGTTVSVWIPGSRVLARPG